MEVTESMRAYTNDKFGPMDKYLKFLSRLEVVFQSNSMMHIVEVIAHVDNHENFVIKKENKDCYACIDKVHDILEKKLTQIKGKSQDRRRPSNRVAPVSE